MSTWVKLHRRLLEWEWVSDPVVLSVFIQILLRTNREDKRWRGHAIPRGSFITSRETIAEACGLSEKQVRRALDVLEMGRTISRKRAGAGQLVTLEKWEEYQSAARTGAVRGPTTGPFEGQPQGRSRAATEEVEEEKKGKKGRSTPEGVRQQPVLPIDFGGADGSEAPPVSAPPPREDRRDPNVQAVIDHLTDKLAEKDLGLSLDGTVKGNRFAAANLLRKLAKERPEHDPLESAKALIDFATSDDFHARNSTKVSYLFRNLAKLRNDAKARRNATKTMSDEQYRESIKQAAYERFGTR